MSWQGSDTEEARHRRVWQGVPWVVNDTASDAQQRELRRHLPDCADCRSELQFQTAVQTAMTAETPPLTDPEAGLARLRERLDRAQQEAGAVPFAALPPAGRPNGWRRLSYALAAAVVVEAVGLTLFSYGQLTQDERAAPYQTLSAAPAPAPAAAIRLLPDPQMRVGDLQRQLRTLELQIVSGPNAAGAYALAPLSADTPLDERIARLRATPGMLLVEAIALPATGSAR